MFNLFTCLSPLKTFSLRVKFLLWLLQKCGCSANWSHCQTDPEGVWQENRISFDLCDTHLCNWIKLETLASISTSEKKHQMSTLFIMRYFIFPVVYVLIWNRFHPRYELIDLKHKFELMKNSLSTVLFIFIWYQMSNFKFLRKNIKVKKISSQFSEIYYHFMNHSSRISNLTWTLARIWIRRLLILFWSISIQIKIFNERINHIVIFIIFFDC